jgi:hypothetical protein
LRLTT